MRAILFLVGVGVTVCGCSKHSEPAAATVPAGSVFLGSVMLPGMVKRIEYTGADICTLEVYGQAGSSQSVEGHCTSRDGGMRFEGAGTTLFLKAIGKADANGKPIMAFQQENKEDGQTNDLVRVNDLQK